MAGKIKLEGENAEKAEALMKVVSEVLSKHHVRFGLDGGTLLGIVREQRLLPWDNDIDLVAHGEDSPRIKEAGAELKEMGYRVKTAKFKETYGPMKKRKLRIMKVLSGLVCVDVIVKYSDEDFFYWVVSKKQVKKRVPRHFYETFDEIEFNGVTYPVPANVREYLSVRYGDWETVVKDYNFKKDDVAIIKRAPQTSENETT